MAKEPDNLVLRVLREMRAENGVRFDSIESLLKDVQRDVSSLDLRTEALDEKFDLIREGTVSAIGFAANASRAHIDLHKQISELKRRVDKLEATK